MKMIKFEIGKTYFSTCWFTGGRSAYTCIGRDEKNVTFSVRTEETDGVHELKQETFSTDAKNGVEYVVLYEYHGNPHILPAAEIE